VIVEEQQEMGISPSQESGLQTEQKETFKDINIDPELPEHKRKEIEKLVAEFSDIFTDVPKVTNLANTRSS